ncbi:MAG: hypothetical protein CMP76_12505 [Flavobacterium sp.]|uniref:hypothetical protein n=1 Tax=Flavobacterium sp. TaxID=239 RepID=UPI000C4915CA|nr:hypothetical protein [Flavobacterium sp.]MBF04108.1 hypothetical protein [Flavobacterium sp.]|tara:strand:+ start:1916 stop:3148 length:1233 start_codon:yes stop_codon:yes gene_type:complete
MKKILFIIGLLFSALTFSQGSPDYEGGLKVKINEEGTKYFRIISWAQFWAQHNSDRPLDANGNEQSDLNFSIRRARILMYAQISPDFLILTHFGLNSLNAENMSPTGTRDASQLFFHDVWAQYSLGKNHAIGGGLHYWNGISRLNNQSTLNIMTLDNQRQAWATLGLSDQFARHLGVYMKGSFGKLQYRVSINEAETNNLDVSTPVNDGPASYTGRRLLGSKEAGKVYAGYFDYAFFDSESNFLPYKVGSYVGTKKVFNIGAGFFLHPSGAVVADATGNLSGEDVSIFAVDAFYDAPLGNKGGAITAYALYQNADYGKDFRLGTTYETGSLVHGHLGYVLPIQTKAKIQPYLSYDSRKIDAIDDNASQLGIGTNFYLSGHNSKLTLEYQTLKYADNDAINTITLQAMIYL